MPLYEGVLELGPRGKEGAAPENRGEAELEAELKDLPLTAGRLRVLPLDICGYPALLPATPSRRGAVIWLGRVEADAVTFLILVVRETPAEAMRF